MICKTLIYNSQNYINDEETSIFKMQKGITIIGLVLDYHIISLKTELKIGLGENLYVIKLNKGKDYIPLEILHNYSKDESQIFSIQKINFTEEDRLLLKIILKLDDF